MDIMFIGNTKFIYIKIPNIKLFTSLLTYAKYQDYIVLIVDQIDDIYMYDERIFNFSEGFIIFYK